MKIKFLKKTFEQMKSALKWDDGKEKACFLLCDRSSSNDKVSLIVREIMSPDETDYVERSVGSCEVSKPFINKVYGKAVELQFDVVKVHIHPPGCSGIFSSVDEVCEPKFMRHIHSKIDGMVQAGLVFSNSFDDYDGWYYDPLSDDMLPVDKIVIVEKNNFTVLIPDRSSLHDISISSSLDRTVMAFGEGRVKKSNTIDIGLIGLGGTGSAILELTARDKPNSLILCDPDKIEHSNLNRLVRATEQDVGKNKAEFYAEYVKSVSPETEVTACSTTFFEPRVQKKFVKADIIFACVDSGARLAINQFCMAHLIPYFDLGASIVSECGEPSFIGGQIYSNIPGRDVCISCSGVFNKLLFEYLPPADRAANIQQGYVKGAEIESPLVANLDFIIAGYAYNEALKYMIGLPGKSSFKAYIDLINDKIVRSNCQTENCLVCRSDSFLGKGDKVPPLYPQKDPNENFLQQKAES